MKNLENINKSTFIKKLDAKNSSKILAGSYCDLSDISKDINTGGMNDNIKNTSLGGQVDVATRDVCDTDVSKDLIVTDANSDNVPSIIGRR